MAKVNNWAVVDAVLSVDGPHVLLYGPPGTSKSYSGQHTGAVPDEVFNVTITPDTSAAELRGHWLPSGGGEFRWHDGPAVAAMKSGGRLVINEIDHAGGDTVALLLAVLDTPETCRVTLPSGETVKPAPGFRAVATMNGRPDDLLEALRNRFPVAVEIEAPHPSAFDALPADLQSAARGSAVASGEGRVGLRSWLAFAALRRTVGVETAAQAVFGQSWRAVLDSLAVGSAT